jgi:drug/metabolite transporter (DMT)-like permease
LLIAASPLNWAPVTEISTRPRQNRALGIALRVGATTAFAFMAALIKLGYEAGVTTPELVFYRFAFGLPPLLLWILWSRSWGAWRTKRPFAHVWRAVIGLAAMACAFSTLRYLPLAESTTLSFAAPFFAVILSALLLKEQVGRHRWSAVFVGLIGVVLVTRPGGDSHLPAIGLLLGVLAALGVALVTITIRQVGRTEGTQTIVLWFTLLSLPAAGLLMPFFAQAHSPQVWAILFGLGTFGGVAQLMMTASLRYAPVSVVAPFDYSQLIWAVALGWLIFDMVPPESSWAGAAIIIASGLYTLYRERRIGREKPVQAAL